jgi:hypothetical protein
MTTPKPGWYEDPQDPTAQRYWDGQSWAPHRQRKPISGQAPSPAPTPPRNEPSPPTPPPATPSGKAGVSKVGLVLAGVALVLAIAGMVASRVKLGTFLPGILVLAVIAILGVTLTLRSSRSGKRKAVLVTVMTLVVAVAIPASLKVVYPLYHHFFASTSAPASGSPGSSATAQPSVSPGSSPTAQPRGPVGSSTSTQAPGSSAAAVPTLSPGQASSTSGILTVDASKNNQRTYGLIDPTSGQYSQVAQFNIPTNSTGIPFLNIAASPDFTKFALSENVNGQQLAGWIDTQGKFTSVTPPASPGPFGGVPPVYIAVGFDGAGNFYYRGQSGGLYPKMFEIAAGSTSNPQEITSKAVQTSELTAYLNYDGTIQFGCNPVTSWSGPNAIVFVAGGATQIDKRPVTGTDTAGCPDFRGQDVALLPASNTARLADAVGNRDGTQVAFKYDDRDLPNQSTVINGSDLYVVSASGGGQPTKVNLPNLTPAQLAFKTFLRWQ